MDFVQKYSYFVKALLNHDRNPVPSSTRISHEILMELSFEDEVERLQVAEEAVRIVKKFNSGKTKRERNERLVELCTEIANILDINNSLARVVTKQEDELKEFRGGTSSASTSGKDSAVGSTIPEEAEARASTINSSPSSGRGTSHTVCEIGTDPIYAWPDRPQTQSRATSPLQASVSSAMSSSRGSKEDLTRTDEMNKSQEDDYTDDFVTESGTEDHKEKETGGEGEKREEKENEEGEREDGERLDQEDLMDDSDTTDRNNPKGKEKSKRVQRQEKTNRNKRTDEAADLPTQRKELVKSPKVSRGQKKDANNRIQYKSTKPSATTNKTTKTSRKDDENNKEESKKEVCKDSKETRQTKPKPRKTKDRSPVRNRAQRHSGREGSGTSAPWYSSDSSLSSEESAEDDDLTRKMRPELTLEYWEIHKLVKFLRVGNPTVTIIALCALQDFSLEYEPCQLSVIDLGAVSILLNLLKTDSIPCVIGSLKVLRRLSSSRRVNTEMYRLGGVQQLIQCLDRESTEVQSLAAETLSHLVSFRKAYSAMRRYKGIKLLIGLLRPRKKTPLTKFRSYTNDEDLVTLRRNACNALWSCSRSTKNIQAIRTEGAVPILASLLANGRNDIILPTVGIIQECANDSTFREDIRQAGLIGGIVCLLKRGDQAMKKLCTSAIFKCAEDEETRELILKHGGLEPMVDVLQTKPCQNKELLGAVAGAVWKCALHKESVRRLEKLGALYYLITQIKCDQPNMVLSNLIGALGEFAYSRRNILNIYDEGVLDIVVNKLNLTEANILINSTRVLALCAKESSCRSHILTSDGLRLLWSLLKSPNPRVVSSAADGISMCVVNTEESAEIVRSFVGGLELVTNLLKSNRREVLISVSRTIINIGQDRENLSIMTDYDVVPLLISLVYTDDEELRRYVAEAIATCCNLDKNVQALSSIVVPLADGLSTFSSVDVHRTTALALEKLSRDPHNCYLIHKHGALKYLMNMTGSADEAVQNAAAGCIKNVRMNAVNSNRQY